MTQSSQDGVTTLDAQETKRQRKKQAKREAKTMLKLEQARQDVQIAEQKVARAQVRLEASRTHLRNLEERVAQMHTSQAEAQNEQQPETSMSHTSSGQQEQGSENNATADTSTLTNQVTTVPPAEGREDITVDTPQDQVSSSSESEPFVVSEEEEVSTD